MFFLRLYLLACFVGLLLAISCHAADFSSLRQEVGAGPVKDFALTERAGKTMGPHDLRGKVWVATFFFTTCIECNKNTVPKMIALQKAFAGKRDVALVSISLNEDTEEDLRRFASDMGADPDQWLFLTGPGPEIHDLVKKVFSTNASYAPKKEPGKEIAHDLRLIVIDHRGHIRGYIDGREPGSAEALAERVRELVREKFVLPKINAALNSVCVLLLVAGYLAIRGKRETLHKACMLSALVVSAAFLGCYLYFHFVVLGGQSPRFPGEGWVRPVYLTILLTHTVLAALVAPLALYVAYQGLCDRRPRHVRLARWTLPIWLYVSITGVVVYWMLYHLYPPI